MGTVGRRAQSPFVVNNLSKNRMDRELRLEDFSIHTMGRPQNPTAITRKTDALETFLPSEELQILM